MRTKTKRSTDIWRKIGGRLREERLKRKLSLNDVSELLGVSDGFYGLLERGKRGTNVKNLFFLCEYFGISIDEIIFGQPSNNSNGEKLFVSKLLTADEWEFINKIGRLLVSRKHSKVQLDMLVEYTAFQSQQLGKI